jgi:hypothetical protein
MTGVIVFVQIVHYPLFERVGASNFALYAEEHSYRTTLVVAPVMLLELATSMLLLVYRPVGFSPGFLRLLALMTASIFLSTFLVQVPLHEQLRNAYSAVALHSLLTSNWVRTFLWSARSILLLSRLSKQWGPQ